MPGQFVFRSFQFISILHLFFYRIAINFSLIRLPIQTGINWLVV